MYYWGKYDDSFYSQQKNLDDKSTKKLLAAYKDIISNAEKGVRGVPPPGVYADYGFLLIKTGKESRGQLMLEKEMNLYPESAIFIQQILKMMEDQTEKEAGK